MLGVQCNEPGVNITIIMIIKSRQVASDDSNVAAAAAAAAAARASQCRQRLAGCDML